MTDNEKIARWLGPFIEESSDILWPVASEYATSSPIASSETLTVWNGYTYIIAPGGKWWQEWQPDEDIALWHGKEGLLAKIGERSKKTTGAVGGVRAMSLWEEFYRQWIKIYNFGRLMPYVSKIAWAFRCAEPAELAAALALVISKQVRPC